MELFQATNEFFPGAFVGIKSGAPNKNVLENDDTEEDETDPLN